MTQLWGTAISNTPAARWKLRTRRIHRLPGLLSAYDRKCVKNYNKRAEQRGFPYAQRGIGSVAIAGTFATTSSSHASLLPVDQSGSDSDMLESLL